MNTYSYSSTETNYKPSNRSANTANRSTPTVPQMNYDPNKNVLFIKGKSSGNGVLPLYQSSIDLIKSHFQNADELHVYLYINEVNTLTIKSLFDIFRELQEHQKAGKHSKVTWFFDHVDQALMDVVYDFSELFNVSFVIVPV